MKTFYSKVSSDTFMKDFVRVASLSQDTLDRYKAGDNDIGIPFARLTEGVKKETEMCSIICDVFNGVVEKVTRELTFKVLSKGETLPHMTESSLMDLGMYPASQQAQTAFGLDDCKQQYAARSALAWVVAGVEVKSTYATSAFLDEDGRTEFLRTTIEGEKALKQIAKYAAQIMLRQHRTSVLIAYIFRDKARLTRWDRAGCIVSTPFDLNKQPEYMLNFVYRIANMTRAEQGYDTSAVLATEQELRPFFDDYSSVNPYVMEWVKDIKDNIQFYPIYKVKCRLLDCDTYGDFLIGKHIVGRNTPTGRATKGFIAFNMNSRRLCFLRDFWRTNEVHFELDVHKRLQAKGVSHIATAIAGGDVEELNTEGQDIQRTVSQKYMKHLSKRPLEHLHSRLVIQELGRPLDTYDASDTLIYVVSDALDGHCEAWEKAGVLHRDISITNVLILVNQDMDNESFEGILIDWDLCKYKEELSKTPTQDGPVGTWAFMCGVSLEYPYKPNDLADDLESFIHVICHNALRFHQHDMSVIEHDREYSKEDLKLVNAKNEMLSRHMHSMYDQCILHRNVEIGGITKVSWNKAGDPGFTILDKESPLAVLIANLYKLLQLHYAAIDFDDLAQYGVDPVRKAVPKEEKVITPFEFAGRYPGGARVTSTSTLEARKPAAVLERVLDTHVAIRSVFHNACAGIYACAEEFGGSLLDKLQDQLVDVGTAEHNDETGDSNRESTDGDSSAKDEQD